MLSRGSPARTADGHSKSTERKDQLCAVNDVKPKQRANRIEPRKSTLCGVGVVFLPATQRTARKARWTPARHRDGETRRDETAKTNKDNGHCSASTTTINQLTNGWTQANGHCPQVAQHNRHISVHKHARAARKRHRRGEVSWDAGLNNDDNFTIKNYTRQNNNETRREHNCRAKRGLSRFLDNHASRFFDSFPPDLVSALCDVETSGD